MPKFKKFFKKHASQAQPGTSVLSALPLSLWGGVALIVVAVFLAYLPTLSGGFLLDDDELLTNNSLIKAADGLYRFWCTTEAADYWPVTNTSLWIEWRLWGINTIGYRVTNLILHIAEALLIWMILRKLSIPGAFLAAMIFAVHPVNVESVAWIAQRKGLLAMLFFLLSMLCYLRQLSVSCSDNVQGSRHIPCAGPAHGVCGLLIGPWYWLSLAAFVLAMLSKGSVAILPVLLLGIIWWRGKVTRWDLARAAPFFLVAVALACVNLWFQTHGTGKVVRSAGFAERLLGAGGVVWFYLYKALLPLNLVFVYPQWHIQTGNLLWWLPLVAAVVVTAVLWRYRESWSRPLMFAWGFFCVSLAPVLGFTDVGYMKYSLVADHYQHLAIIGVIALAAACWSVWHQQAQGLARAAATATAVAVLGTLTLLTYQQGELYRDAITLYRATLEKNPDSWLAHCNLGNALLQAGRPQEAIKYYEQTQRLKPDDPEAYYNMGNALLEIGRPQEAIKHYEQALRLKPDLITTRNNLGIALVQTGRHEEAIKHYEQALRLNPNYPEAHYNLGSALLQSGRMPEAIDQFQQVLRLKPDFAEGHFDMGKALFQTGRPEEAITHFRQAVKLKADYIKAYYNLALAYAETHQSAKAIAAAQQAWELARSKGQTALAKQIEDWLNSYRAGVSE